MILLFSVFKPNDRNIWGLQNVLSHVATATVKIDLAIFAIHPTLIAKFNYKTASLPNNFMSLINLKFKKLQL